MIEVHDLHKTYPTADRELTVLAGISAVMKPGTFTAICGPSGCGKSTLLFVLGGLLQPDHGRVTVHGEEVFSMSREDRARWRARNVGFVFQRFHLLPYLSVEDNIRSADVALGKRPDPERARALMQRFHMLERARHLPGQLSVGERQRTALARALFNGPRVLLADEPTGNLDPDNADIVLRAFVEFAADGGTVVMVTHHPDAAARAGEQWRMREGSLASEQTGRTHDEKR